MSDSVIISRIINYTAESRITAYGSAKPHPFSDSPIAAIGFAKQSYMRAIESGNAVNALGAALMIDNLMGDDNPTDSATYIEGALALADSATPTSLIAEASLQLCAHEYRRGQIEHAFSLATIAIEHANKTTDVALRAGAYAWKARTVLAQGNHTEALEYSHHAHAILSAESSATGNDDYDNAAVEITILTGTIYQQIGEYDSALTYMMEAAGLARTVHNNHSTARVYTRIAIILLAQHNYTQALEYCSQALHFAESASSTAAKVDALAVMTRTLMAMKEYERLFTYAHRALSLIENSDNSQQHHEQRTALHRSIGRAHFALRTYSKALYHLQLAIQSHSQGDDDPLRASLFIDIASVFRALHRYDDASVYVHHALSIADRSSNAPLRARAIRLLSSLVREQALNIIKRA